MYLYNNLFFFYPTDNQETFKEHGGDETAYKNIRNDVLGLGAFKEADPEGLHTMEMAVVEYRGRKLVGHTLVPGLLARISKGEDVVVYGTADYKKVASSEEFFNLVSERLAKSLHLGTHAVVDPAGKEHNTVGSVELKGIVGNDKRNYLIDLSRVTPRDLNFNSKPSDIVCVLRPELLQSYMATRVQEEIVKKGKETEAAEAEEKKPELSDEQRKAKLAEDEAEFGKLLVALQAEVASCNDLYTQHKVSLPADKKAAAEKLIADLARFLREDTITVFVHDVTRGIASVLDGDQLVQTLHSRGINLRYLGQISQALAGPTSPFRDVLLREMIVRAAKRVLSAQLVNAREHELATKVADFFNAFFNRPSNNPKGSRSGLATTGNDVAASGETVLGELTHSALWSRIRSIVDSKYAYQLPEWIPSSIFEYPTLRTLCQRTGVRLEARQYDLILEKPFDQSNIFDLVPVVKHRPPQSVDGISMMDAGRQLLESRLFERSHEAFASALAVLVQIYGHLHKDVAECHSILAHVSQLFQDHEIAFGHQQQATAIYERVTGSDSRNTANAYGNLALATRKVARPGIAVNFIKRAIYLTVLGSGSHNHEMWNLFLQLSEALSEAGKKEEAVDAARRALLHAEPYVGAAHHVMAQLTHALALRLSAVYSFREALDYEKRSFAINKQNFGETHARTEESNMWLQKLTKMAVQAEVDSRKKSAPGAAKPSNVAPAQGGGAQALHSLPVAQLVQYINAGSGKRGVGGRRGPSAATAVSSPKTSTSSGAAAPAPAPAASAPAANGHVAGASQPKKQKKKGASNNNNTKSQ